MTQLRFTNKKSSKDNILVVDDDQLCQDSMQLVFLVHYPKYGLLPAYTYYEAMAIAKEQADNIKLAILDLSLKGGGLVGVETGITLYKSFQQDKKLSKIPIIFQSGHNFNQEELQALRKASPNKEISYMRKPCPLKDLLKTLESILGPSLFKSNLESQQKPEKNERKNSPLDRLKESRQQQKNRVFEKT